MTQVFMHEIERLKKQILALSAQVEENVILAVKALRERDETLARQVEESDAQIDAAEVDVEEEALKILALYQPVAMDLRFLASVLKINNDLERIGDLAANIAKRARKMCSFPVLPVPEELHQMACHARDMVRDSLNAFVNLDDDLAASVCKQDETVDQLCKQIFSFVEEQGKANPDNIKYYLHMMTASRNLERIGDHTTNIAEDVMYLVRGVIVRHGLTE
ncbi:MAG: phosphate transport system protein [Verrucomicrobiota bacterium]|jgi:phosphate transport system protein|nr:phosphate transport system protein [Verrucomicrobiota bacterium]MDK2962808.1 phosphate transport system protein [Verrucomicrobiota bacterium]